MNHYPHHIGDFDKATRHLTRVERGIYRDMIEVYYDTEGQLTKDITALCRLVLARTDEERTAVQQVLSEFFNETPTGWYHSRCELELEKYRANASQKAVAGKASAAARALKAQQALNGRSTGDEQTNNGASTNRKPLTVNQEPNKKHTAEYSAEFLEAWEAYPPRSGANKKESYKAWLARLKAGVSADVILDGVRRYANYCKVLKTEDRFIKQPASFFGPGDHYLSNWTPQSQNSKTPTIENFANRNYGTGVQDL